ncbi:MAG: adenylyl cyclase, partial [Streptosporangiaceae bacterium]
MTQSAIQADLNAISTQQVPVSAQFDSNRYAVLFEPGTYGSKADPLVFQVGYYTEVAGLGAMPQDTVVNGAIDVFDNLCGTDSNGNPTCNADDNFWRSLSNLDLNVDLPSSPPAYAPAVPDPGGAGCENSTEMWAVSQATPIRRAIINGSVVFQDYCGGADNYASGGFIADSQVTGDLNFYGNQQYMTRNSSIGGSNGALWNMVYSGVLGAPAPSFSGIGAQNTVLPTSPVTEEQPFLYQDASGSNRVFVPAVQTNSSGTSWSSGSEAGSSLPLSSFFIANPSTSVAAIDVALALGKNLVLTPGVYNLNAPIIVSRPDTVVLGLGFATLVPQKGNAALVVLPNKGVKVSGLMVDAGPVNSPALVSVGTPLPAAGSATDPDTI